MQEKSARPAPMPAIRMRPSAPPDGQVAPCLEVMQIMADVSSEELPELPEPVRAVSNGPLRGSDGKFLPSGSRAALQPGEPVPARPPTINTTQRQTLTNLLRNTLPPKPGNPVKKAGTDSVANKVLASAKELPEYQAALKAVRDLAEAIAKQHDYDERFAISVNSDTGLDLRTGPNQYAHYAEWCKLIKKLDKDADAVVDAMNAKDAKARKAAADAWEREWHRKQVAIQTATTMEELFALVPELDPSKIFEPPAAVFEGDKPEEEGEDEYAEDDDEDEEG
jgi:hypothetical protein